MKENKLLRQMLFLRHGCNVNVLYFNDGEMQCKKCNIDFKRLSAQRIKDIFEQNGRRKLDSLFHQKPDREVLKYFDDVPREEAE